ncbi:hypothetical protein [Marinobacter sp. X15-166B]|uniref:hypothetical protein n=1 Tax=Marinobacter sp. X15-166B TaxID=1897620 RepID=UPI00085C7ADC|nr:hypothetical protein [Marinobacter sp. X15-166B]OEY67507.1 hypothetical protein BG841_14390 [Marinobacter sp. X15-166B]
MTPLSRKERWLFSIILPLCAMTAGYFLVIATTDGQGSSIGFRAIGVLVAFPIAVLVTALLNFLFVFSRKTTRSASFAAGMVVPILLLSIEYAYLWQVWEQYPGIS